MQQAQQDGDQKTADLKKNIAHLDRVLAQANEFAMAHPNGFLFSDKLTTGDVFFLPILRIFTVLPCGDAMFRDVFAKYPSLKGYWERALANRDVQEALMYYTYPSTLVYAMVTTGVVFSMLRYMLGLLKPPKLPQDIEDRIKEATDRRWEEVRG